MDATIREQVHAAVSKVPDPNEVLRVHCINCDRPLMRARRVVEKMNLKDGFVACSNPCRRKHKEVEAAVVAQRIMHFPDVQSTTKE